MDVLDLASKGIAAITAAYGKKIKKEVVPQTIERNGPLTMVGGGWRAGFGKAEIMPDLSAGKTYWIAGHGSGHKMEGVLNPVYVNAVWLDVGADEGVVWLSADIVGLTNVETEILRTRVRSSPVLRGVRSVNISCTHSHAGIDTVGYWGKANALSIPADGKDPAYMEQLFDKAREAAEQAFLDRRPGKLYAGKAPIPGGLFTKRKLPEKHEVLYRLRFAPDDGSSETWLLNVGAHPNSLGGDNRLLSGEYPHFLRERIHEKTGARVHFGVGAIGGMDAAEFDPADRVNNVKLQGEFFADAAMGITEETALAPEIRLLRRQFYLPVDNPVLTLLAMRGTMSFSPFPCKESALGIAIKTEMTLLRLGGCNILFLPGEQFVSTVYGGYVDADISPTGIGPEINPQPLCEIAGDPDLIVYGNTNDMTGYVVPPNDFVLHPTQPYLNSTRDRFDDNHYHETNSMGPGTQKTIAETFRQVVEDFGA